VIPKAAWVAFRSSYREPAATGGLRTAQVQKSLDRRLGIIGLRFVAIEIREKSMVYRKDRCVWAAVLFRTTRPEVVEGAIIRRTERLHWTSEAAIDEVREWAKDVLRIRSDDEIEWRNVEGNDNMSIGLFTEHPNYVAVVRTMFLPVGKPPRMR
jgi:hypothetical protein